MGLLARLFRFLTGREEKRHEVSPETPPDSSAFLTPRERPPIVPAEPPKPRLEDAAPMASPTDRTIVATLGDVLSRIPPEFLREEPHDGRRGLKFGPGEFFADIPRGRVTVALSNIAAQVPDVFRVPITDDEDREVRLPLQKVLDQLVDPVPAPPIPAEPSPAPSAAAPAAPEPEPTPPPASPSEPTLSLSLAAIIAACPEEIFPAGKPTVPESARVELPLAPIERQLETGRTEISAGHLIALLPSDFAGTLNLAEGVKIPLPLEEIFRNLPRAHASGPDAQPPVPAPVAAPVPATAEATPLPAELAPPPPPPPVAIVPPSMLAPVCEPEAAPTATAAAAPEQTRHDFTPQPPAAVPRTPPPIFGAVVPNVPLPEPQAHAANPPVSAPPLGATLPSEQIAPVSATSPTQPARPLLIPPLRALESPLAGEMNAANGSGAHVLQSTVPSATSAQAPADEAVRIAPPPIFARPVVVLPPPIPVADHDIPAATPPPPALVGAEGSPETTADQAAVLEFLSESPDRSR